MATLGSMNMPLRAADPHSQEFVSCVMATQEHRRQFLVRAVQYFLRQTYTASELVIVDDAASGPGTVYGDPRVRYLWTDGPASTGTKLNIGIAAAHGNLITKMDDDDYYHPEFLKIAVASLLSGGELDRHIAAWDCFLVLLAGEGFVRFSGHGYAAGGTLSFSKALWQKAPFRDTFIDEDRWFKEDHGREVIAIHEPEMYILVRHGRNTWVTLRDGRLTDAALRRLPRYPKRVAELMDMADADFYTSLPTI